MKNDSIPPNPHPVKPPPNMPEPRKESLEAENARLNAEVDRLDNLVRYWSEKHQIANARFLRADERIKSDEAEVERLDTLCKQLGKQHSDISCDNIMLRKAGDAMADVIAYELRIDEGQELPESVKRWLAAKEGKPSV